MYDFIGKFITDQTFCALSPRRVFYRQLERPIFEKDSNANSHILFRKSFVLDKAPKDSKIYISADDYYKLYVNGKFVGQGPAPSYIDKYCYNTYDITDLLVSGKNVVAVHTYYQGLINRVWISGDNRHGLIFDLYSDGKLIACSDESVLTHRHSGYSTSGSTGYDTQFMEEYDSNAKECGFFAIDFDDRYWENSVIKENADYKLVPQTTAGLKFERIVPAVLEARKNGIFIDFGKTYVGSLSATAKGKNSQELTLRFGQELNDDGSVRYQMRCNCTYEEKWILSGDLDTLIQFDYKSFRYAEIIFDGECEINDIALIARHYPFELAASIKPNLQDDKDVCDIWELCVNSQKYGVQEVIQDCMDREKGFYMGDGCYTSLAHLILSGDDRMTRKLIDDGFHTAFVSEGLLTCMDCSFCQEIAEYPLILISFIYWHYQIVGDKEYLKTNYYKIIKLLEVYRKLYEKNGLLNDLDKWCVVEWPSNFRDGYAVDIREGMVCTEAHVSINAYYMQAIKTANKIAEILELGQYRPLEELVDNFNDTFYDSKLHRYVDGTEHRHVSLVGNVFPFAFGLCDDERFYREMLSEIDERGIESTSLFCAVLILLGLNRLGEEKRIVEQLKRPGAWLNMLKEGATTTFEGWSKDSKWNTSLFHLTFSYASIFIADFDLKRLLI